MITLELAANLAEILAGLAIVGAAIRAWPIFRGMEQRLGEDRKTGAEIAEDIARFRASLKQVVGAETDTDEPLELLKCFLQQVPALKGSDVYFEYFPARDPTPGVISYLIHVTGGISQKHEFCALSSRGYEVFFEALEELSRTGVDDTNDHAYLDLDEHRFLVSLTRSISGRVGNLRLVPQNVLTVEDLAVDKEFWWPQVSELLEQPVYSTVVCAGPIGSGKSTTASSLIDYACREKNYRVVSMELPVEFVHDRVIHLTCENEHELDQLYRSARGQNPDLLFIGCRGGGKYIWNSYGERRVMASVTANDAVSALELINREGRDELRTIEWPFVILGQLLVRHLCRFCAVPVDVTDEDSQVIDAIRQTHANAIQHVKIGNKFSETGPGCEKCTSGYRGRIALIEKLDVNQAMMNLAVGSNRELRKNAIEMGMASIQLRALGYASTGRIAFSELKRISREYEYEDKWGGR